MPHLHAGRRQQRRRARKRCHKCRGRASHQTRPHRPCPLCGDASDPPLGRRRRVRAQLAATWARTHAAQQSAPARRLQLLRRRRCARARRATTGALPRSRQQGAPARRPRHPRRARAAPPDWRPGRTGRVRPSALPWAQLQQRARLLGAQRCCARRAPRPLHQLGAPAPCACRARALP